MASPQASVRRAGRALVGVGVAIVLGVGVIVGAASLWFRDAVYGDRALPAQQTDVVIAKGASFSDVVDTLRHSRVLAHPLAFRMLARLRHVDADVKAGEYRFPAHQTTDDVLQRLVRGEQFAVWVTIPEGYTAKEIAAALAARGLADASAYDAAFLKRGIEMGGVRTQSLEGYLFPSTYLVPTDDDPQATARILVDQFRRELPPDAQARAAALHRSIPEIVTIASLVEREGKVDEERPLIASVIYNRLRLGMPLEIDASIEYTFAEHHDVITKRDLESDSPYNTYRHTGLPPTPIANPGKPSLDAAFRPAKSDYLYYVARGDGRHAFAKTLAEHNANVERYLK
ncbi:aminodeoxychorismate lyase [Vulcanimicrobium alpinum]|uniref:Endolytic murein transglycosylase n=1 Tax=Vulcanimicrobium alpinum TaxID=3016050 RepID=A0AAN1XVT8_UNVUL|nr:endolytic transglycosylase MltG [Vulcanimicrobium alpinum]BDE06363.1 aminodeoxychorismate lyase [Vulcanimicrobium alpinum]